MAILVVTCAVAAACGGGGSSSDASDTSAANQAGEDASGGDASADDPAGTYVGASLLGYTGAAAQTLCGADSCPDAPTSITITCATAQACDWAFTGGISGAGDPGSVQDGHFSGEADLTRTCSGGKSSQFRGQVGFTIDDSGHLAGQLIPRSTLGGDPICPTAGITVLSLDMTKS